MTDLRPLFILVPLVAFLLATAPTANATVLLLEDFDDPIIGYTQTLTGPMNNIGDPGFTDGGSEYFGRVAGLGGLTVGPSVTFTNTSGGYFGAQDTNGAPNIGTGAVNWTGIDISGFTNLSFSGLFAEDADNGIEAWDPNSEVLVRARIDGGAFFDVFSIQSSSNTVSATAPLVDTDFDGLGDGAEITDTFTQFVASIAGTGSLLDLQILASGLTEAGEDIAFDNIMLSGTNAIPEPGSLVLLGSLFASGVCLRRRRRKTLTVS